MLALVELVDTLRDYYGPPAPPLVTDPFEMILWENVAYLVNDEQRGAAFNALRRRVGTTPTQLIEAPMQTLAEVVEVKGTTPLARAAKLRQAAVLADSAFGGRLEEALHLPLPVVRKALKRFPGIGDPGADKILLFTRTAPVLALDSNGLRVLLRVGYGVESAAYGDSYKSVQQAVAHEQPDDFDWLIGAHQLLRQHGRQLCRRASPLCGACPLAESCNYRAPRQVGA